MRNAGSILLLLIGLLSSATTHADEQGNELTPAAQAFIADLEYSARPPLTAALRPVGYHDHFLRPLENMVFEDNSLLGRLSQMRGVAFFTFVDGGDTLFFLGVDRSGLVGLHFRNRR